MANTCHTLPVSRALPCGLAVVPVQIKHTVTSLEFYGSLQIHFRFFFGYFGVATGLGVDCKLPTWNVRLTLPHISKASFSLSFMSVFLYFLLAFFPSLLSNMNNREAEISKRVVTVLPDGTRSSSAGLITDDRVDDRKKCLVPACTLLSHVSEVNRCS